VEQLVKIIDILITLNELSGGMNEKLGFIRIGKFIILFIFADQIDH